MINQNDKTIQFPIGILAYNVVISTAFVFSVPSVVFAAVSIDSSWLPLVVVVGATAAAVELLEPIILPSFSLQVKNLSLNVDFFESSSYKFFSLGDKKIIIKSNTEPKAIKAIETP